MALPHQVGLAITYDGTVKETATTSSTASKTGNLTHKVVSGDTLWALAKKHYGSGSKYTIIYDANKSTIESAAKARGRSNSKNGHYIYPGTVLVIPNTTTTTKATTKSTGKSIPALGDKIEQQASALSYTDVASGQSDSVSITLFDIEKEWMGKYMPQKGASLGVKLQLTNWNQEEKKETFNCGTFVLDDISFSGRPLSCVLGGVSVPAMDDFKSLKRTKTWEKTTIKNIASEIAKRAGVSLNYSGGSIQIAEIEQNKQTDSAFLYSLCEKYGLAMKVYNNKIVIFSIITYESKKAVQTLNETDMISWDYNTTVDGTYTGIKLSYTDPDSDKTIDVTIGSKGRMYEMNTQASSKYDAELQAIAAVNLANRKIETMDITIRANPKIVASHCVTVKGLGKIDGKYYVDKIVHSIGRSGYQMKLTLHKVQTPIGVATAGGTKSGSGTYKVVSGDNLWNIAKKYYGSGAKYTIIYNANKSVIESAAKSHGRSNSKNGHYIYPGTVLTIPEV